MQKELCPSHLAQPVSHLLWLPKSRTQPASQRPKNEKTLQHTRRPLQTALLFALHKVKLSQIWQADRQTNWSLQKNGERIHIPKRYGQSQITGCPFCGQQSTTTNSQKIPVCVKHKERELQNLKCMCGSYLDLQHGKFGPFFTCWKCGSVNMRKALELNPQT